MASNDDLESIPVVVMQLDIDEGVSLEKELMNPQNEAEGSIAIPTVEACLSTSLDDESDDITVSLNEIGKLVQIPKVQLNKDLSTPLEKDCLISTDEASMPIFAHSVQRNLSTTLEMNEIICLDEEVESLSISKLPLNDDLLTSLGIDVVLSLDEEVNNGSSTVGDFLIQPGVNSKENDATIPMYQELLRNKNVSTSLSDDVIISSDEEEEPMISNSAYLLIKENLSTVIRNNFIVPMGEQTLMPNLPINVPSQNEGLFTSLLGNVIIESIDQNISMPIVEASHNDDLLILTEKDDSSYSSKRDDIICLDEEVESLSISKLPLNDDLLTSLGIDVVLSLDEEVDDKLSTVCDCPYEPGVNSKENDAIIPMYQEKLLGENNLSTSLNDDVIISSDEEEELIIRNSPYLLKENLLIVMQNNFMIPRGEQALTPNLAIDVASQNEGLFTSLGENVIIASIERHVSMPVVEALQNVDLLISSGEDDDSSSDAEGPSIQITMTKRNEDLSTSSGKNVPMFSDAHEETMTRNVSPEQSKHLTSLERNLKVSAYEEASLESLNENLSSFGSDVRISSNEHQREVAMLVVQTLTNDELLTSTGKDDMISIDTQEQTIINTRTPLNEGPMIPSDEKKYPTIDVAALLNKDISYSLENDCLTSSAEEGIMLTTVVSENHDLSSSLENNNTISPERHEIKVMPRDAALLYGDLSCSTRKEAMISLVKVDAVSKSDVLLTSQNNREDIGFFFDNIWDLKLNRRPVVKIVRVNR